MNSSWFKTICPFIPGLVISFLIYVYFPTLYRSSILFPFECNFLLWPILFLVHKHQRKIAAFLCLNLNLFVFLMHAMVGVCDMNEDNPQIIFEPLWTIKRELVWLYIVYGFLCCSLSLFATSRVD